MKCVCPYCGKMTESGKIGFDFTEFISNQLKNAMGFPMIKTEDRMGVDQGIQSVFNNLPAKDHLIFTEEEIWNWEKISESPVKTVIMYMPYDRLIQIFSSSKEKNGGLAKDSVNKTYQWLMQNSSILCNMCFPLILVKEGSGDIRFNLIRSTFDQKPIVKARVCPACGEQLSFWSGRYPEICLGVLGGPRVSKTTTLTACASAFMKPGGYKGITWQGSKLDKEYIEFSNMYLRKYEAGTPIDATKTTQSIPRVSFCVNIRDTITNVLEKIITLTFVDLPGELTNEEGINDEFYSRYAQFFENVDYIWYCTDPGELMQNPGSTQKAELGYEKDKQILTTEEISDNMMKVSALFKRLQETRPQYIEFVINSRNTSKKEYIPKVVPVAYILGKSDSSLCAPMEKKEYRLYPVEPISGHRIAERPFDLQYFTKCCNATRYYMYQKNSVLVNAFEYYFPYHCFIPVSAYGFAPTEEKSDTLRPFNVTAPFMWMLTLESCIKLTRKMDIKGREKIESYFLQYAHSRVRQKDFTGLLYNIYIQ